MASPHTPAPTPWPQAVLFDLDGTLVNSLPDIAEALNDLFNERGWSAFSLDEVREMIGGGVPRLIERALIRRNLPSDDEKSGGLAARFLALYSPRATRLTQLFPDAKDLLADLSRSGTKLGICTNKPEEVSRKILDALDVSRFFGAVIGGDTLDVKKPAAGPVHEALRQLNCTAGQAVMVGDSGADSGAARAAGIPVLLVSFGYTQTPVADIDCDGVVDSLGELPAAFEVLHGRL